MDEQEKTRVTSLVNTGAQIVGGVLSATHPAFGIPISILRPLFAEFTARRNARRKERLTQAFAEKVAELPPDYIEKRVRDEGFQDLLEGAIFQIARPVSQERIEQIAALLKHGLTEEDVNAVYYQTLLDLLGQLNDAEVIVLRSFSQRDTSSDQAFRERHQNVLNTPMVFVGAEQTPIDKQAVSASYYEKLQRLRLLKNRYGSGAIDDPPEFSADVAAYMASQLVTTRLGNLLLRTIETETQKAAEGEPSDSA